MKNTLFMVISSFLPLALLKLFAQNNSSMAQPQQGQPQMGQPQGGPSPVQGLETFSLPVGTITENDMPRIKAVIQQVLKKISESKKSAGKRADYQTVKSVVITFQEWLRQQGCVSQASTTYDLENTDKYSENIFMTYPGQLPFDIVFRMGGEMKKQHRLLIFVSTIDLLDFASLVENKSIGGVPALKNWPSGYLEVRPRI
jgi:hypothetical protein